MNPSKQIDQRVSEFDNWKGTVFSQLRKTILSVDPEIEESWKWDTAVWLYKGKLVCAVGVFKESVKLNFFQGAALPDPNKLFNAGLEAKKTRAIDFREGDNVNKEGIENLLKSALLK